MVKTVMRALSIVFAVFVACVASSPAAVVAPIVATAACTRRPLPPPSSDASVTPTGDWTQRADIAINLIGDTRDRAGALTVAITVIELWPIDDLAAKRDALNSLRAVRDVLTPELRAAVAAYRGGDGGAICRANNASRAIGVALRGVAVTLARAMHWDIEEELRFALSLFVQIADELNPSCAPDAGWSSLTRDTQSSMSSRGRVQRFPTIDEARRISGQRDGGR